MVVGLLTLMPIGFVTLSATAIVPSRVIAADKIVRTQVIGFGKTKGEAYLNARHAAEKLSFSWKNGGVDYSGSNGNWTCLMIIEYVQK
jgi:hypothetical protein